MNSKQKTRPVHTVIGVIALLLVLVLYCVVHRGSLSSYFVRFSKSRIAVSSAVRTTKSNAAQPPEIFPSPFIQRSRYATDIPRDETIPFMKDGQHWKTYRNNLYGFEVSIPANWEVDDESRTVDGKQNPYLHVRSPSRFDLPGAKKHGASFFFGFYISPQDKDQRKITLDMVYHRAFIKAYELGDQAVNEVSLTDKQLKATTEYKISEEIIPTIQYLYSKEDAKTFVQSIPTPSPVVVTPQKSEDQSNWKIFIDREAGFSIQYPPSWVINRVSGPDGADPGKDGLKLVFMKFFSIGIVPHYWIDSMISIYKSKYTANQFFENYYSEINGVVNRREYQVNNNSILYFEYPIAYQNFGVNHRYLISHKGLIFDFVMGNFAKHQTNDGAPLTIDLTSAFPDFEKMVNSIHFDH